MDGRTQLIIDGVEVVLPQGFATTVKRENSFFTKNGEYTYDCQLSLDNDTNRRLYGFLQRLNKTEAVRTKRPATLMADGKVYCRGTEVITGWTDEQVSVQIVAGNSELNYFIGDSLKIEFLDLGEIQGDIITPFSQANISSNPNYPTVDYCLPTVYDQTANVFYNLYIARGFYGEAMPKLIEYTGEPISRDESGAYVHNVQVNQQLRPQPFLCAIVRRLIQALGYTIGENQLEQTQYKKMFLVNTRNTKKYAEMLSGWTVQDFLEEVENICNVCFLVDNIERRVDILQKSAYYANCRVVPLQNVVDEYELEVQEDSDAEWSNSDISYDLPDNSVYRKLRLNKDLKSAANIAEYPSFPFNVGRVVNAYSRRTIYKDTSTGRLYIMRHIPKDNDYYRNEGTMLQRVYAGTYPDLSVVLLDSTALDPYFLSWRTLSEEEGAEYGNAPSYEEVDQLADLEREGSSGTLELKLKPAPMALIPSYLYWQTFQGKGSGWECLRPGMNNIVSIPAVSEVETVPPSETTDDEEPQTFQNYIENYESPAETSAGDLYCAFYAGLQQHRHSYLPQAHTDAYHAMQVDEFQHTKVDNYPSSVNTETFEGSLRLQDIDAEVYGGVYRVDTSRQITFETYDPNMADPRAVYVIRNKRYVCRDIEETITAKGRKPRWKMTCHPIDISDTAAESRWVLTKGVWDDGGAWLDDGRWNDSL